MKTITFLFAMLVSLISFTQINYQAQYTQSGAPVALTTITVDIKVLDLTATGTAVYTETFTPTTNEYGVFTVVIGTGVTSDVFANVDWSTTKFIELKINGTLQGVSQVMSVPSAIHADVADKVNIRQLTNVTEYSYVSSGLVTLIPSIASKVITVTVRAISLSNYQSNYTNDLTSAVTEASSANYAAYSSIVVFYQTEDGMVKVILK